MAGKSKKGRQRVILMPKVRGKFSDAEIRRAVEAVIQARDESSKPTRTKVEK
jgi:hypothetical protein